MNFRYFRLSDKQRYQQLQRAVQYVGGQDAVKVEADFCHNSRSSDVILKKTIQCM